MKLTAPPLAENLDEQVAIKVMGLPVEPWSADVKCPYCGFRGRYCGSRSWCSDCGEWYSSAYKHYQDSIEDAMEVVEKMWQIGWQVEVANTHKMNTLLTDNVRVWWVRFIKNENDMDNWSAEADSLPEAICRAALAATEASPCIVFGNLARRQREGFAALK